MGQKAVWKLFYSTPFFSLLVLTSYFLLLLLVLSIIIKMYWKCDIEMYKKKTCYKSKTYVNKQREENKKLVRSNTLWSSSKHKVYQPRKGKKRRYREA